MSSLRIFIQFAKRCKILFVENDKNPLNLPKMVSGNQAVSTEMVRKSEAVYLITGGAEAELPPLPSPFCPAVLGLTLTSPTSTDFTGPEPLLHPITPMANTAITANTSVCFN